MTGREARIAADWMELAAASKAIGSYQNTPPGFTPYVVSAAMARRATPSACTDEPVGAGVRLGRSRESGTATSEARKRRRVSILGCLALLLATPAQARGNANYIAIGAVTFTTIPGIRRGDEVLAFAIYDPTAPDVDPSPSRYESDGGPTAGLVVSITVPPPFEILSRSYACIDLRVVAIDGQPDRLGFVGDTCIDDFGAVGGEVVMSLNDSRGLALSAAVVPANASVAAFDSREIFGFPGVDEALTASIDELLYVPEPAGAGLAALLALGALAARRRHAAAPSLAPLRPASTPASEGCEDASAARC